MEEEQEEQGKQQNLLQINQETNEIIQQLIQVFQKVQKNLELMGKTIDLHNEVIKVLQKTGKTAVLYKHSSPKSSPGQQISMKSIAS